MRIIRIFLLLVMVIVGITAFAPEWLDLKDVMVAEYSKNKVEPVSKPFISQETISSIEGIIPAINQKIVVVPRPETIGSPGAILLLLLWYGFVVFMYVGFLSLYFIVFLFSRTFTKKNTRLLILSSTYPKLFVLARLVLAFGFSLFMWYYLVLFFIKSFLSAL